MHLRSQQIHPSPAHHNDHTITTTSSTSTSTMAKSQGQKRRREAEADQDQQTATVASKDGPPSKKSRVEERRSLFVRSLPPTATSESLTEYFSQHYPVKHATVVVDKNTKESRGYGFVTFTDADDALEAKKKLQGQNLGGRRLVLDVAEPRHRAGGTGTSAVRSGLVEEKRKREAEMAEARKAPKLIIRNLPWSVKKPEQLSKLFMKYGKIKFTDLPSDKGKMKGFGFVTFKSKKHAEIAMEKLNGKDVDGRTIAVDWAVTKDDWEKQQAKEEGNDEKKEKKEEPPTAKKAKTEKGGDKTEEDEDLANFMKKMEADFDSEDDEAEEDDEEGGGELNSDEDDEDGLEDDEEDAEVEDDVSEDEPEDVPAEADKPKRTTDNSTTVFIRNLPFTATDESLKEHFTQFGPLRYARVVMNKAIDKPAGTGFVCFVNMDDFKTCVKNAPRHQPPADAKMKSSKPSVLQDESIDADGRYTLDGRVLQVAQAVSKEEATRLNEVGPAAARNKLAGQDKDKRRLFLLSEGTIPKNSPLFGLLSDAEIKLREQSAAQRKKQVMGNPSLHLSLTRLAVRNLPHNTTAKDLKALARQAVVGFATDVKEGRRTALSKEELARGGADDREKEAHRREKGRGVVKQAKVVFETKDGRKADEKAVAGAGKSRGYGFVEYSSHRWALMGLRWLNGHPLKNEAGRTVRLVVEFAIENAQVVSRRRANESRARTKRSEVQQVAEGEKGKTGSQEKVVEAGEDEATKSRRKDASEKLAQRQRIIGRKRMARKSKVSGRKGKA